MSIEAQDAEGGVISTRNGVPPQGDTEASDPPGGVPRTPDPDPKPHPAPEPGQDLPENEPPHVPPHREAHSGNHRSHHKHK